MDHKLCDSCGSFIDGLCNTIAEKDAEIAKLKEQRNELENDLFAVFYLAVEKWFDDPEAELKESNRATMGGKAREIALQAIEKESHRADEAEERLQKAEAQIEQIIGICDGTIGPYGAIQHHAEKALNAIRGKEESK